MVEVIKYNVTKDGNKVINVGGGTYYNKDDQPSEGGSQGSDTQLWSISLGDSTLVPTNSQNTAEGTNSTAVGNSTQATNDGEFACGHYNVSNDTTLFSVGDGEGSETRHNAFEVGQSGITATNAIFNGDVEADNLQVDENANVSGSVNVNGSLQVNQNAIVSGTLQANHAILNSGKVNGLLDANQLKAVSGYIQTLLSDSITTDYLTVTKAAHFFKLIIDEIKATQGQIIITPANAKLDKVSQISGGWRCYFRAKDQHGKEIFNNFEVNDQIVCQTFNAATGTSYNVSNKYYWRLVTATGSTSTDIGGQTVDCHYFDLSESDCDLSSMTPSVDDECVLLGNRTDTTRQAAIVISAYNSEFLDKGLHAPSIVQYAGINNYNLSSHRLNVISNGLNQFKGAYSNNQGTDIEQIITTTANTLSGQITAVSGNVTSLTNNVTTLSGTVTSHTQSISELTQTDSQLSSRISANTTSIGTVSGNVNTLSSNVNTLSGNVQTANSNINALSGTVSSHTQSISQLQQTADGLTSTVSSHTSSIATLNGNLQTVSGNVNTLSGTVQTQSESISQLQQTSSSLTSTVSAHTNSISTLNSSVNTVSGNVNTLNSNVNTLSGDVQTANSNISSLSGTVQTQSQSISQLQQTADGLTSTVSSHTNSISTLNSSVNTVSGNVNTLNSNVNTLSGDVQTATSNINTLSGTVQTQSQSISQLQQTSSSLTSTVSSHTNSISTLSGNLQTVSGNVNTLSGTVQTQSQSISQLQQTSSSLTSTVSAHTNSISTLNSSVNTVSGNVNTLNNNVNTISGDVGTIKSDYVTSTQLTQTASGISATVESDISGKLLQTGININDNLITMSSDNVQFTSASGDKTWLVGKAADGSEIFRLGRSGDYTAELYLKTNESNYARLKPDYIYLTKGTNSWGISLDEGYPFMQMYNGSSNRLAIRYYNGRIEKQLGTSTTWQPINSMKVTKITTTTTYNIKDDDEFIVFTGRGEVQFNLPSASSNTGRKIYIKDRSNGGEIHLYGYICRDDGYNPSTQTYTINNLSTFVISDGECWIAYYCA